MGDKSRHVAAGCRIGLQSPAGLLHFPADLIAICRRGKPKRIRSDNGPEYISELLKVWAENNDIILDFIQPGNPQQNAYVERYNRTVRYDWLAQFIFKSIEQVQEHATRWLWTYNNERPNMAIGGITPMQKLALAA